jgi:NCS1 family nucleobase:cation symporter-1
MGWFTDKMKWAEVEERKDIYNWRGTTEWGNYDLYPVDEKDCTFGYWAYCSFWSQSGFCITTYTIGSGYIAVGLSQGETIGAIFLGSLISAFVGIFGARPGIDYRIGYVSV